MRRNQQIWQYFREHRAASIVAGHIIVVSILGLFFLGNAFGANLFGASAAAAPCASSDQTYVVVSGDTLGTIAARYGMTWQNVASYNRISDPNMLYIAQHICIPGKGTPKGGGGGHPGGPVRGTSNPFPYGQCTWYASQRFFQMHGVYVPWTTNANAWQWTARAYDFHWQVSASPSVGAIVDLQPWTRGAYGLGHVAFVERVLGNGHVIASNMNWGGVPWNVTNVDFAPGAGVTFISL